MNTPIYFTVSNIDSSQIYGYFCSAEQAEYYVSLTGSNSLIIKEFKSV